MKTRVFMAGLLALAALAPPAFALTVQNDDMSAYTVAVKPKTGAGTQVEVKSKATADVACDKGCTLTLSGKSLAVDAKTAKVLIKSGHLVAG
ncbi:MAG: hypothetical protein IPM06_00550 [Rhizobiales bacterium]|nr:hypothetical protein [Hyphomicrobiales bacterium]